jgi:hypothetical protein
MTTDNTQQPKCDGCGGTIAEHTKLLHCRCDATRYCDEWPNCSPPCHIGRRPVAWRVRGYNQFKTGEPGAWRYIDGASRPKVSDPNCCDIEPLYASGVSGTRDQTFDQAHVDGGKQ